MLSLHLEDSSVTNPVAILLKFSYFMNVPLERENFERITCCPVQLITFLIKKIKKKTLFYL